MGYGEDAARLCLRYAIASGEHGGERTRLTGTRIKLSLSRSGVRDFVQESRW